MRIYPQDFITHLSDFGLIRVSGADAASFLQGQVTCDVREVTVNQAKLGAICSPQGRVQAIFVLLQWQQDYYLAMPQINIDPIIERLKKYILFAKVSLTVIAANELQVLAVRGAIVNTLNLISLTHQYACFAHTQFTAIQWPDDVANMMILAKPDQAEQFMQQFQPDVVVAEAWHFYRLQQEIPLIYPDTYEQFTAHDLNLPILNAVSFTKGCYCGQEIIARMQYRAQLKQRSYYAELDSAATIKPGVKLENQHPEQQAIIVDSVYLQNNHYKALVFMQDSAAHIATLSYNQTTLTIIKHHAS